jgi:membrane-bound lytic murein transglycosylase D
MQAATGAGTQAFEHQAKSGVRGAVNELDRLVRRVINVRSMAGLRVVLAGLCVLGMAAPSLAADAIPRPPELERDVGFWIRVYSEITTHQGFLHDERNLAVVYETLNFGPQSAPRDRQALVDAARDRITASLRRVATGAAPLSADDQRMKDMWGAEGTPLRLLEAARQIRFQLGQSDRFKEGLIRSGAWESHIADTFASLGLPPELAALPHVESSFNPEAYSKVGAAGLWQFMRSTGRRYMRIDSAVDERMDPFRSTEAAAQLLQYNYRVLGTWPLALTAYNHGAAGLRRAKQAQGTDDIVRIVRHHRSRSFGFASRNFYVSFLAALEIDRNPEKYFGPLQRRSEARFQEVAMPAFVPVAALEKALQIERATLRSLNPALLSSVWNGQRHVPRGYRLRLPSNGERWTSELIAQRIDRAEQYAGQPVPQRHRVRRGETLAGIAQSYGISTTALAAANGLSNRAKLRSGRYLDLPHRQPIPAAVVAATAGPTPNPPAPVAVSAPPPAAPSAVAARVYVVRRGDSISEIATRVGMSESELLRLNGIRNPNFIFEGQRLALVEPAPAPVVAASRSPARRNGPARVAAAAPPPPAPVPAGTATVTIEQLAAAEEESARDVAAVAAEAPRVAAAEPVSAAQAAALGPSLGPAMEASVSTDAIDYGVAKDDTIGVAAAETLGHYADWLGVSASRLRQINRMKYGRPVLIGNRVKLDFSRTSQASFEERRRDFHRSLQASYFAAHRIIGTEVYVARRGDSLWTVTQRYTRLPVWLLQQYNPDVDLSEMRAGTQIVVPRVEEVAAAGG